jgi:hypothetical protein
MSHLRILVSDPDHSSGPTDAPLTGTAGLGDEIRSALADVTAGS